jgi:hypothetical protein
VERIPRRVFARRAALAATAIAAPKRLLVHAETTGLRGPFAADVQESEESKLSPESRARVEATLQNILRKYGDRFSEDQKKRLRRIAAENERLLAAVRAFPLENWDPPANVLKLYPDRAPRPIRGSTASRVSPQIRDRSGIPIEGSH